MYSRAKQVKYIKDLFSIEYNDFIMANSEILLSYKFLKPFIYVFPDRILEFYMYYKNQSHFQLYFHRHNSLLKKKWERRKEQN